MKLPDTPFSKFNLDEHASASIGQIEILLHIKENPEIDIDELFNRECSFVTQQIAYGLVAKIPMASNLFDYFIRNLPKLVNRCINWSDTKIIFNDGVDHSIPTEKFKNFENLDGSPMSKKELINYLNQAWAGLVKVSNANDDDGYIGIKFCLENKT